MEYTCTYERYSVLLISVLKLINIVLITVEIMSVSYFFSNIPPMYNAYKFLKRIAVSGKWQAVTG